MAKKQPSPAEKEINAALKAAAKEGGAIVKAYGKEAAAELDQQLKEIGAATVARTSGRMTAEEYDEAMSSHLQARKSLVARVTDRKQRIAFAAILQQSVNVLRALTGLPLFKK